MYDQIREDPLYIILYAMVTAMAMMASCYMLFRRGNAIARDITSPVRLRRWTGVFFAATALNHVWYMPIFFLSASEDIMMTDLIGGLLDSITVFPLAIIVLFVMLQDRRRPLWPVAVMMVPLVVAGIFTVATRSYAPQSIVYAYFLLMCIGLVIYFVRALRQYGRWLRDNYADLEHKEVWQSFVVLAIMLLVFGIYAFIYKGAAYQYAMLVGFAILIGYLLWRVETLSELSMSVNDAEEEAQEPPHGSSLTFRNNIEPLLKKHCEEPQLYLQHDLNILNLAAEIGINRSYLSKYFSSQGTTYNAYINSLRIQHFVNLYRESAACHQHVTAQEIACQSGFRSYNTFSVAFKKIMGMTATEWMRNVAE